MPSPETDNQVNESPRSSDTAKPGTGVLKAHPREVRSASVTMPRRGLKPPAPRQEVPPQIMQQVPRWKSRTDREREPRRRPGNAVSNLVAQNTRVGRDPNEANHQAPCRGKIQEPCDRVHDVGNPRVSEAIPNTGKSRT